MNLDEMERVLQERLDALGPAPRAELLHTLTMPDYDRAGRIGEFYGNPMTRTFAELLIDCEENPHLRAVLVGMLRTDEVTTGRGDRNAGRRGRASASPTDALRQRERERALGLGAA